MMRSLLLIMVLLSGIASAIADNKIKSTNSLGIDDECYAIFSESRKHRTQPECLDDYKRMLSLAKQKGDKAAICHAMSIPMLYYRYQGSEKEFLKAMNDMRKTAAMYNLPYYYWWCFSEEIGYYISTNRTLKALNLVHEKSKEAKNDDYARFSIYNAFGDIYMARRDELHARESFLNAEKIAMEGNKKKEISYTYINLARITEAYDTVNRGNYLQKAYINSINPTDSACALMGLAYLRSNQGKKQEFMKLYRKYKDIMNREMVAKIRYDKWYKSNEAYRMLIEGKNDSAMITLNTINDPYMRFQAQADFYRSMGDYKKASMYYDSLVIILRSSQSEQNIADVAEINAVYETDRLRNEADSVRDQWTRNSMMMFILFMVAIIVMLVAWSARRRKALILQQALSQKLQKANEEAVQASKMKDVFIQNMSHEIRTPLNAVVGFAQLLTLPPECLTDEKRQEFASHIQNNTNLLTMLIDDILNISDVESGSYRMSIESYPVNEIVSTAISTIKYRVPDNIQLIFDSEVSDEYIMQTDARRVQQVLVNFLTNSIKHTDEGFIRVVVSLKENKDCISFIVEDTGTGIPIDKSEDIFKRFEKLNAFKQGTGLGLNICRVISEKLNGRCYLDTEYPDSREDVEHGARFVFALPLTT